MFCLSTDTREYEYWLRSLARKSLLHQFRYFRIQLLVSFDVENVSP